MVAQAFQQPPRGAHGLGHLGINRFAGEGRVADRHAQAAGRTADRGGVAMGQRRGIIGRAQIGAFAGALVPVSARLLWLGACRLFGLSV